LKAAWLRQAFVLPLVFALACGTSRTVDPKTAELLGPDDGAALAIFYGAELFGSVDGCGCFGNAKAGGPPYRYGFLRAFESTFGDVAVLDVDAGDWSGPVRDKDGTIVEDLVVQDEWVVRVLDHFGIDAVNVTARDVDFLAARYLHPDAWDSAVAERPAVARFVSANLRPVREGLLAPPPYVVREKSGTRLPGGRLRIAIVGVTEDAPSAKQAGFEVVDPAAALGATLPKARAESDMVVVLAALPPDRVAALARSLGGSVDLFVVAHPLARDREPEIGDSSRIVYARYKSQRLGELRVILSDRTISKATNRYVPLDDPTPRDAEAERLASEARDAVHQARTRRFEAAGGR